MLLIVGPTRGGKGTIARVLTHLIGPDNVAGPTLASLASNFGLAPMIGRPFDPERTWTQALRSTALGQPC